MMNEYELAAVRAMVREVYGSVAAAPQRSVSFPRRSFYEEVTGCRVRGLGCGEPLTFAKLQRGERVLDLGSGVGYDCLAAAVEVGLQGRVIGIDVTSEMAHRARRNAIEAGAAAVLFMVGDAQSLPFPDASFDVVISNCVVNLCPDKTQVFAEAYRVLRPGGRMAISDIVSIAPLPPEMAGDLALYAGCVAGAPTVAMLRAALEDAGFRGASVQVREESYHLIASWAPGRDLERYVSAADIVGRRD